MDQRDIVIRTIIGEAANESPQGWAAVANVLKNRAGDSRWPDEVGAVALQPKQFSAWNDGAGGNDLVRRYSAGDRIYDEVGQIVDAVFSGQIGDNTGGATHYYSPAGMQALVSEGSQGNILPRWLQQENDRRGGQTTTIGGHIFTGQAGGTAANTNLPQSAQQQPLAPAGFTQEQIAAAFSEAPQGQPVLADQPSEAPAILQPAQTQAYQSNDDALARAMASINTLKEKRKGLLPWA